MSNGEGQPRAPWVFGYAMEKWLREAGDPDLWLEAENLCLRVYGAAISRRHDRAHGTEPQEDGGSHENAAES